VGGDFAAVAVAEREVTRGRMPEHPFVLVRQQYLADPTPRINARNRDLPSL